MNIWFAADIPQNSYGGVARSMQELAAGLKNHGHKTIILTRGDLPARTYLLFALKLCVRYILSLHHPPDWIIARSTDALFCAIIIRLCRLKTGIILHNHGWEEYAYALEKKLPRRVVTAPTTWRSILLRFPLLRLTLKLSTYCMSGTVHEMASLSDKYPSVKHRLVYIPNGVTMPTEGYWQRRDTHPLHFLCIGNVTWKKNIAHTLRVFSLVRETHSQAQLTCIGTGCDDEALYHCTGSNLEGVTNIPSVPFDRMHAWYTTCPFMITSSRYEGGHSLAILEALSYGIIVFASAIPSNKELISDGINGYCISGSNSNYDAAKIIHNSTHESHREIRLHAVETAHGQRWHNSIERLEKVLCRKQ